MIVKKEQKIGKIYFRVNDRIKSREVLLIDVDGTSLGVHSLFSALEKAKQSGLDLVEISPNSNPPVARIMDFGRYKYEQEKKERENKNKAKNVEVKEIRLSVKIGAHDLEVKAKKAKEFIEKGHKIIVSLRLHGRENMFVDRAIKVIENFAEMVGMDLSEKPQKIGNQIRVYLVAKKEDNH